MTVAARRPGVPCLGAVTQTDRRDPALSPSPLRRGEAGGCDRVGGYHLTCWLAQTADGQCVLPDELVELLNGDCGTGGEGNPEQLGQAH